MSISGRVEIEDRSESPTVVGIEGSATDAEFSIQVKWLKVLSRPDDRHIGTLPEHMFAIARMLESWGAPNVAIAWTRAGLLLNNSLSFHDEELLDISQAANESGYTRSGLWKLIHGGKLENYGEEKRPLLKRGDLPRKPGSGRIFV